jgi:MFS family permease
VHHAPYYTVLVGSLLLAPFAMLYPLMPSAELASVMLFFAIIGTSASAATSPSCIIAITPGELRGLATAMFYFAVNLLGALIAPPVVGIVTDWMGAPEDLKYAMVIVAFGFSIVMLGVLVFGLASFKRSAAERATAG